MILQYLWSAGIAYGSLLGIAGMVAAAGLSEQEGNTLQSLAERNNIDISNIIYKQWIKQLKEKSSIKVTDQSPDVQLVNEILIYGISVPYGFSTTYVPVLRVHAQLIQNNKVIWQDTEHVFPSSKGMPRSQYIIHNVG